VNRILNAIADPTRRRTLHALKEHGGCSIDKDVRLVRLGYRAAHSASQPTVSHHMAILSKAGLVDAKKIGLWRWYRRNETSLRDFA